MMKSGKGKLYFGIWICIMMALCLMMPAHTSVAAGKIDLTISKGKKKAVFATVKGDKLTFGKIKKLNKVMGKSKKGTGNEYSIYKNGNSVRYKKGSNGRMKDISFISLNKKGYSMVGVKVGDTQSAAEKKLKKLFGDKIKLDGEGFSVLLSVKSRSISATGSLANEIMGYYISGWYEKGKVANISFVLTSGWDE